MPIRTLQFSKDQYYHLFNRGANRQTIFRDDKDYLDFLTRFKKYAKMFEITVIAYVLMPNHYHFLVRQDGEIDAGKSVQLTGNGYVQRFNLRNGRTGILFEGRFKGLHVDNDPYLHHLCRYIHGNPVKEGFALQPELWPYSNYPEWSGKRNGELVDRKFITDHFGTPLSYEQYLYDYLQHGAKLPPALATYLSNLIA